MFAPKDYTREVIALVGRLGAHHERRVAPVTGASCRWQCAFTASGPSGNGFATNSSLRLNDLLGRSHV